MSEAAKIYKSIEPYIDERINKRRFPKSTGTPGRGGGTTTSDAALAAHVAEDYAVAHSTASPTTNKRQEYWSENFGIIGGAGVDESNHLLDMFNAVGAAGGGILHINALTPGDPIRLDKLVSIYYSNMDVRFSPATPLSFGAAGGLRIMGSLDEFVRAPATNAGKLDSTAAEGDKILVLATSATAMQADDFAVGDQIVIRGENDASGGSLYKQICNVVAIDAMANELELAQELEYTFEPTYPASEWPADLTTGTTIYIIRTVNLSADAARGDMELSVSNLEDATVGDLYRISDGRNEHDLNAAALRGSVDNPPYLNDANMEFVRIVAKSGSSGAGTITLDRPLSNDYLSTTPYFGALAHVLPVVNSHISGARISYYEDQVSKNAHSLAMGFCMDCSIEDCTVDGYLTDTTGKWSQACRIADSFNCWGRRLIARGAPQTDSSEGYQFTHYKATGGGFENCEAYDGRHNYLVQASVLFTIRNCQSHNDHISGFDLHGANERDGVIENCLATRSNGHTSDASNGALLRIGNTSHAVGSHYIRISNCKLIGAYETNIAGIDILPASTNILVDGLQIEGCYYGIKFTRNAAQCQPVQSASNIIFQNCQLSNIIDRAVYIQCEPTYNGTDTVGRADYWTLKGITLHNTLEHFHIAGDAGCTDLTIEDCSIVQPITSPGNDFYGYNVSGVTNLIIRDSSAHRCSRGIRYASCVDPTIVHNTLTATIDNQPLVDGGSNTGTITIEANSPGVGSAAIFSDAEGQPADVTTASADGTSAYAARRDHAHTIGAGVVTDAMLAGTYLLLAGRAGGQAIYGSTLASENLALISTAHATKGKIYLGLAAASAYDEVNDRLGIGVASPAATLDVARGTATNGTVQFRGTTYNSVFNYDAAENTYIRGGKAGAVVYLNDSHNGDVRLADGGGNIYVNGTLLSTYIAIANDSITFAKLQNISTDRLIGRDTAGTGDAEEISVGGGLEFTGTAEIRRAALTGDVTATAGSNTTTIANDAVTFAKMQNIATARILGRNTASTGDIEELAAATVISLLGITSSQWATETGGVSLTGKVRIGSSGVAATLLNLVDTNATIRFGAAGAADSSVFGIDVAGSGSSTNSGHGRNLLIAAGASDNASTKIGGSVIIRPGDGPSPALRDGDIYLADLGGRVKVGDSTEPTGTLDIARGPGADGTLVVHGTTWYSAFNFSTPENTYIRAGKTGAEIHLNDAHNGAVFIAGGGGATTIGGNATMNNNATVNGKLTVAGTFAVGKGSELADALCATLRIGDAPTAFWGDTPALFGSDDGSRFHWGGWTPMTSSASPKTIVSNSSGFQPISGVIATGMVHNVTAGTATKFDVGPVLLNTTSTLYNSGAGQTAVMSVATTGAVTLYKTGADTLSIVYFIMWI